MNQSLVDKKIFVAGHRGMVGSALVRRLDQENCHVLTATKNELDLRDQSAVFSWLKENKPNIILLAAAKVGGIHANQSFPADFIYDNLIIACNVIQAAKALDIEKLLFLGSSCIYPKYSSQPMTENLLLTGSLEPTNQWYAIAKIAGLKMIEAYRQQFNCDFISCMPCNLYGPNDNYDLNHSHVLPALIRKIHEAKLRQDDTVTLWGTGSPRREFLYVDDLADACVFLLKHYSSGETINIGVGKDLTIHELANLIAKIIGYQGTFLFDTTMPDGTPQKLLDVSRLAGFGWQAKTELAAGIALAYQDYLRRFQ